jgi:hypothetical protein
MDALIGDEKENLDRMNPGILKFRKDKADLINRA